MICILHPCRRIVRLAQSGLGAAVLVLGLAGCAGWGSHDDGLRDKTNQNDLSATVRKARSQDDTATSTASSYWNFDDRGREIERDLNVK
jgi:hypothetical protein